MEAPETKKKKKIPVVYYLCRNRRIEHPHFIEVPLSSPDGLYLRDVINRLNLVRGKGMPTMYSWSCKRSYKNGFVWHDLSYDDLILPANGDEYVLKGSELLDQPSSDRIHPDNGNPKPKNPKQPPQQESPNFSRSKEASFTSSSTPTVVVRESKPPPLPPSPQEDEKEEEEEEEEESSQEYGSSGSAEYRVYKPIGSSDATTQTDDAYQRRDRDDKENENLTTDVSTDNGSMTLDSIENHARLSNGSRSETLESLLRADARKKNSFRILKEEEVLIPTGPKMKPSNILMQLITCGSITVKDHENYGIVSTYQPSFSHMKFQSSVFAHSRMLGELDCLSKDPRLMGLKLEDKEYFSGSLIETKKHREDIGERMPVLKRSSSYNAESKCKLESGRHEEEIQDTSVTRCLPRAIKLTHAKQPKNEKITSPMSDCPRCSSVGPECNRSSIGESGRSITDASSVHGSSRRLESFKEEKEKLIRIEESLRREPELLSSQEFHLMIVRTALIPDKHDLLMLIVYPFFVTYLRRFRSKGSII